jgi:acetyltransferase-like isoleucine patch superfamily enzyme
MRFLSALVEGLTTKRHHVLKYARETLVFGVNQQLWALRSRRNPNLAVGDNFRTLTGHCLKVELPSAHVEVGNDVVFFYGCEVLAVGAGTVSIGDYCTFGSNLKLHCRERVSIGEFSLFSWNVFISDFDPHSLDPDLRQEEIIYSHRRLFPDRPHERRLPAPDFRPEFTTAPVTIGRRVWVGANVIILKGVSIGDDVVIGAGSVVAKDIPAGSIAVGNPARVVRTLQDGPQT